MTGNVDIPPDNIPNNRYSHSFYKIIKKCINPKYEKRYHISKLEEKLKSLYNKLSS